MNLFDSKRPQYDEDWKRVVSPNGKTLGIMPIPSVYVEKSNGIVYYVIRVSIHVGGSAFTQKECEIPKDKLDDFFAQWIEDPEKTLETKFGIKWDWRDEEKSIKRQKNKVRAMDLSDLGL